MKSEDSADFQILLNRVMRAGSIDPSRTADAGLHLIDGALRIRRGGDGIYGIVPRPVTKPAEAVGAWIGSMAREIDSGLPFARSAELKEALVAAAEEVNAAVAAQPAATRLRSALFTDALGVFGNTDDGWRPYLPWMVAVGLGGILAGVLITLLAKGKK